MPCINHPDAATANRCAGCAESFCSNCLVTISGQPYCAKCKKMAVTKVPAIEGGRSCTEAGEALKYAIIGIFCFGIIFGPMSIFKALDAKSIIAKDPSLSGSGKATAALIIGCIVSLMWVLGIIARVSAH
jgi:hypothetical protein